MLRIFLVFCLAGGTILISFAQTGTTSPLSAFSPGEINSGAFSRSRALGNAGICLQEGSHINFLNPAGFVYNRITTFETGIHATLKRSYFGDSLAERNNSYLGYFALAFPAAKNWGIGLGVLPFSSAGFLVRNESSDSLAGKIIEEYEATGGLNQIFLSNGFRIFKNLNFGVNASWIFGSLENTSKVEFPNLNNSFNTRILRNENYSGIYPSAGLQFSTRNLSTAPSDSLSKWKTEFEVLENELRNLPDSASDAIKEAIKAKIKLAESRKDLMWEKRKPGSWKFVLGLTGKVPMEINRKRATTVQRYYYSGGNFTIEDTTQMASSKGKVSFPLEMGIGFGLIQQKGKSLLLDARYSDWSQFDAAVSGVYGPGYSISLGFESVALPLHGKSGFLRRIKYRLGVRHENKSFKVNGQPVTIQAFSAGAGFPLRKSSSEISWTMEFGRMTFQGPIRFREDYLRFTLGLTICDTWFIRRKLD